MRVLSILTSNAFYGKERSNIEVYQLLKKEGHDVHVLISKDAPIAMVEAMLGLTLHTVSYPKRHSSSCSLLKYAFHYFEVNIQAFLLIKRLNPDVLFFCSELNFYDLYPVLRLVRKKMIYRIGDAPAFTGLSFYRYNSWVWYKFVVPKVHTFICISQYIKQTVEEVGRESSHDVIIYNYPPKRNEHKIINEAYLYENLSSHNIAFGYIGQINQQKGVDLLVKSASKTLEKYPQVLFLIAGSLSYDQGFALTIKSMIPEKYRDRIVFLGEISDIKLFFKHIKVLCVPSVKQEPLGNVLVEAKANSCPCIIFPTGGMPELVRHKVDGYICQYADMKSLLDGISYFIEHKDLMDEYGIQSFESIQELGINRESFECKWREVFEKLQRN